MRWARQVACVGDGEEEEEEGGGGEKKKNVYRICLKARRKYSTGKN
jgi:hypothetical protein